MEIIREMEKQQKVLDIYGITHSSFGIKSFTSKVEIIRDKIVSDKINDDEYIKVEFNITDDNRKVIKECECKITLYSPHYLNDHMIVTQIVGQSTINIVGDEFDKIAQNLTYRFTQQYYEHNWYYYSNKYVSFPDRLYLVNNLKFSDISPTLKERIIEFINTIISYFKNLKEEKYYEQNELR